MFGLMNICRTISFVLGCIFTFLSPLVQNTELASWVFFIGLSIIVLAIIHLFADFEMHNLRGDEKVAVV